MKVYLPNNIIRDVKVALDLNKSSVALTLLEDVDSLSIDDIIKSKITESVKIVHNSAPVHLLDGGYNFGDAIYWTDNECGYVLLPEDFMRFVVFEMDDWERPVLTAITHDNPIYKQQSSRFKGLRGTAQKPVCALSWRPEGKVLEFFSCKSTEAKVRKASYIPYPNKNIYEGIEICEKCYKAVIYQIAALVCLNLNEHNKADAYNELSKSLLI